MVKKTKESCFFIFYYNNITFNYHFSDNVELKTFLKYNVRKTGGIDMEETFADYILKEEDWVRKMEIMYYLEKKAPIFFDKSVVLKTELAKLFMDNSDIDVDKNLVITACLLCNCKKPASFKDLDEVKSMQKMVQII